MHFGQVQNCHLSIKIIIKHRGDFLRLREAIIKIRLSSLGELRVFVWENINIISKLMIYQSLILFFCLKEKNKNKLRFYDKIQFNYQFVAHKVTIMTSNKNIFFFHRNDFFCFFIGSYTCNCMRKYIFAIYKNIIIYNI